jgi:phytoene dehydrogenase-like protein
MTGTNLLDSRFQPEHYGIGNWNIWYYPTGDLNQEYQKQLQGDLSHPWIFLSCPALKSSEPGMAPPGHHVLDNCNGLVPMNRLSSFTKPISKPIKLKNEKSTNKS